MQKFKGGFICSPKLVLSNFSECDFLLEDVSSHFSIKRYKEAFKVQLLWIIAASVLAVMLTN